jgi:hypothetical protein
MAKRKKRNKIPEESYDVLQPIDISIFGTDEDPCFGKHYSLEAKECKRCGDAQVCSIICAQVRNVTRAEIESKDNYKDIQTETEVPNLDLHDISLNIVKLVKKKGDQRVTKLVKFIKNNFDKRDSLEKSDIRGAIIKIVKDHPELSSYKDKNIRYIKWKK